MTKEEINRKIKNRIELLDKRKNNQNNKLEDYLTDHAEQTDSNHHVIESLNKGRVTKIKALFLISQFYDCSLDYLLGLSEQKGKSKKYDYENFRTNVNRWLGKENITYKQFTEQIGISRVSLSKILSGKNCASTINVIKIARAMGKSVDSLF